MLNPGDSRRRPEVICPVHQMVQLVHHLDRNGVDAKRCRIIYSLGRSDGVGHSRNAMARQGVDFYKWSSHLYSYA